MLRGRKERDQTLMSVVIFTMVSTALPTIDAYGTPKALATFVAAPIPFRAKERPFFQSIVGDFFKSQL